MIGSQLVIRTLKRRGVRVIFSLSGNQIMPLYDACIDAGIRIVHVRHEAAAVFMADAWFQVTGEIGVALLTAGPGLANGVGALYSAAQAESALLLISGDSPLSEDGRGAFQEMDQTAITRPLTKRSSRLTSSDELTKSVDSAITLALSSRCGPVHLALPFDLAIKESGVSVLPPLEPESPAVFDEQVVDRLASLLSTSQAPLVVGGPSSARGQLSRSWRDLSQALQAPVIAMESPRGLNDPAAGILLDLLTRSDLIVLAGKRLDFSLGYGKQALFATGAGVVALDPDPAMLERAQRLLRDRLVLSCPCDALALLQAVANRRSSPDRAAWLERVRAGLAVRDLKQAAPPEGKLIGPKALCEQVQRTLSAAREPILVCDGGEFGQWAQAFCSAPVRLVNGLSGAIGGSICYAIAAKIARPEATVVALLGDGTSGFHLMEFDTAVRENAPFVAVIGNDLRWNAERLIQLRSYGPDRLIGCELADTAHYHDVARALGGFGAAVRSADDDLDSAIGAALASGLPACINVAIDGQAAPTFCQTGEHPQLGAENATP